MRWTVTGHSDFVRIEMYPHANSQASSQGQHACSQVVTPICEDCEAIFFKDINKEIFIETV